MKRKSFITIILLLGMFISAFAYGLALRQTEVSAGESTPRQTEGLDGAGLRQTEAVSEKALPQTAAAPANAPLEVAFSHDAGFYAESFSLTLSAPEGAAIYYTLDGSPPKTSSTRYTRAISVAAPRPAAPVARFDSVQTSRVTVFSIKAIAVMGGKTSETAVRNFVTGTDVFTRFSEDTLIFALNSDPHGLYDYHDGILVPGIDRDQWRQEYVKKNGKLPEVGYNWDQENPGSPANFNRRGEDSERPVYVEMFDSAGTVHISQKAGMRVKGGYSRAIDEHKSLELYARDEYGDRNTFLFPFFGEEHDRDGQLIHRYRRIRLRNGGSDRSAGFIRDELSQSLFRQAGHPDTQMHTPAAVFLNGKYYGAAWLKTPRTENHLARIYGGVPGNFEIVDGGDNRFTKSWWNGEKRGTDDLHQISELAMKGFIGTEGQARFNEFSRRMDVDSLIRYYAMEIYINNYDWPNHNIEMWRYFPTEAEKNDPSLHPYLRDGRWRVSSHDIEASWAIWDDGNKTVKEDTIRDILTGENKNRWNSSNSSAFFYALVGLSETKGKIANTFADLIEGAFSPDNVIKTLNDLSSKINNELNYALRMDAINPGSLWWPTIESIGNSREAIRRFAKDRPGVIYDSIQNNLGFSRNSRFTVKLTALAGGGAVMNSRPVNESQTVTGNYFSGTTIHITALPYPGYVVDYWMVDGVRKNGDVIAINGKADVTLYFQRCPDFAANGNLYISAVKAKGSEWVELRNDTGRTLNTKGLFLSDSNSNFQKWEMPEINVNPGTSIIINLKNGKSESALEGVQTNFNIGFGERLRLSDINGNVLSLVEVSLMNRNEVQRRMNDGKYRIVENK